MILLCLLFAVDLNPPDMQDLIQSGLEYAYVESFDSAAVWFDSALKTHPDFPAGWFYKAALLQVAMMDGCRSDRELEYFALLDSAIAKAGRYLGDGSNPWALYYLGSAYTYKAIHEGSKKNYWTAFSHGLKGGKILKNLVETYPEAYDAYLGAGSFDYFWARASGYLPVLRLVGDFTKGVEEIKVAQEKGTYSRVTAQNALVWIYTQEGKQAEGIRLADDLVARYPNSRTFLWSRAGLLLAGRKYEAALVDYERLYAIYDSLSERNYANLAQAKLLAAKCLLELDRTKEARSACDAAIGFYRYRNQYPQINAYVNEAKALKRCL